MAKRIETSPDIARAAAGYLRANGLGDNAETAIPAVATRITDYRPEAVPDKSVTLSALALLSEIRTVYDRRELVLIDHARQLGATWDEIGRMLGYNPTIQGAAQRRKTLAELYLQEVTSEHH
jgi:hypothetical protein